MFWVRESVNFRALLPAIFVQSIGTTSPHLKEVFLSCCETNLGVPKPTDDIFTLAAGFLCAGANTVISTLWAIDDLATAWFTLFYYQARYPDPDIVVESAIALQTAQNRLRNQSISDLLPQMNDAVNVLKKRLMESSRQPEQKALYNSLSKAYGTLSEQERAWKKLKQPEQTKPYASPYYWAAFVAQGL